MLLETDGRDLGELTGMANTQNKFDELLKSVETRERRSRRNAIVWMLLPMSAALVFFGYGSWLISSTAGQLAASEAKARQYRSRIQQLEIQIDARITANHQLESKINALDAELRTTQQQLRESLDLSKYRYPVDSIDLKLIDSEYPREANILDEILRLRERRIGWRLRGKTPEQGFDSPAFAEFILRKFHQDIELGDSENDLIAASRKLYDRLAPVSVPNPGDLVFYPAGYVMFYFKDAEDKPFVIGMTPVGITALQPDFAHVLGYRRP